MFRKGILIAVTAILIAATSATAGDLPDPRMTPGALNPNVTQDNLDQTVCVRGYTKTIRPPVYYTNKLKRQQLIAYGYFGANPKAFEEDHLVALSIGGHPTDPRNLWPQPRNSAWGADKKDELEYVLYKKVCAGEISVAEAQRAMASNWIEAYKRYVPAGGRFGRVD